MSQEFVESEPLQRAEDPNCCSFCGSCKTRCASCGRIRASKSTFKFPNVLWKKVLHEKQPYEDNYLDETFLSSLVPQETSAKLTYPQVVMQAMEVSLATSFVSLYLLVFMGMLNNLSDSTTVASANTLILLTGVVLSVLLNPRVVKLEKVFTNLKSGIIVMGIGGLLFPRLQNLFHFLHKYAEDTTYAISHALILIHLVLKDYTCTSSREKSTIKMDWSTLAIMYLTITLGSKLIGAGHNVEEVFALWLIALTLFVFAPSFQKILREYSLKVYKYTALIFIIGMGVVIYNFSKIGLVVYVFTNFIIFVVGPLGLLWFY